jgi:hypothetical protein
MARVCCKRAAVILEIFQQLFERIQRCRSELFALVTCAKEHVAVVPLGEGQAAKAKPNLTGLHHRMNRDGVRCHLQDWSDARLRAIEKQLRLAMGHDPGFEIPD